MGGSTFKIVIDRSNSTTNIPGNTISGHVFLDAQNEVHMERVSIRMSGRCKTRMSVQHGDAYRQRTSHAQSGGHTNETIYRGVVSLFSRSLNLFQGPYTLRPNTYQWPFSITIPMDCCHAEGDEFSHEDHYDVNRAQPLPPSFQSNSGDWTEEARCYVSYELNAKLEVKGMLHHDLEDEIPVTIIASGVQRHPELSMVKIPQTVKCRSYHLDGERENKGLSIHEKFKSFFNSSDLPTAVFTLTMRLPSNAAIGQPIPVLVSLDHDWTQSTASSLPLVRIVELKVCLNAWTGIRCDRYNNVYGHDYSRPPTTEWDEDQELVKLVAPIDLTKEEIDLTRYFRVAIPNTNVTTFETFNISRQYRLKIKMTLECAQVKNKVEFIMPGFRVLSPFHDDVSHEGIQVTHEFQHEMKPPSLVAMSRRDSYNEKAEIHMGRGMDPPR